MRHRALFTLLLLLPLATFAEWAADFPVGADAPAIKATAASGERLTNDNVMGQQGAVFFFTRSTSW